MSFKLYKCQTPVLFLCVCLFFLNYNFRYALIPSTIISVNYLAIVFLIISILYDGKLNLKVFSNKDKLDKFFMSVYIMLWTFFIILTINRGDLLIFILYGLTILLPLAFLNISYKKVDIFNAQLRLWMSFFTIIISLIILGGIVDYFSNHSVSKLFAQFYSIRSLLEHSEGGRMVSFMGHPLLNAQLFLTFYIMYFLYRVHYLNKKENLIVFIICFLGIALTGSKAGVFLLSSIFVFFHRHWRNYRIVPLVLLALYGLYRFGFLELILKRLLVGDLTTGRNDALFDLLYSGVIKFQWINGKSIDTGWKMVAALEYPVLRWAYQFGIIVSILLTILLFVYPFLRLFRNKSDIDFYGGISAIIAYVNVYNGMALHRDHVLIYVIIMIFVLNMSDFLGHDLSSDSQL